VLLTNSFPAAKLPLLFNTTETLPIPDTPAEMAIGKYLRGAWAAFAKNPRRGLLTYEDGWPEYVPNRQTLVRLGFENKTGASVATGDAYDIGCARILANITGNDAAAESITATVATSTASEGAAASATGTNSASALSARPGCDSWTRLLTVLLVLRLI
jgi:cholinesterase